MRCKWKIFLCFILLLPTALLAHGVGENVFISFLFSIFIAVIIVVFLWKNKELETGLKWIISIVVFLGSLLVIPPLLVWIIDELF